MATPDRVAPVKMWIMRTRGSMGVSVGESEGLYAEVGMWGVDVGQERRLFLLQNCRLIR